MFWDYLKFRKWVIAAFVLFEGINALVFALYRIPFAAYGYAGLITAAAALIFLAVDFILFRKKVTVLRRLKKEILLSSENLPKAGNSIENGYEELIMTLREACSNLSTEAARRYDDMKEYYTMWAHQIKTPMAAMRLILAEQDSDDSRALTEELQRIEQYVEMVMCYLRLDSDSTDYVIKQHDVDEILRRAVRKFSSQFIRRRLKLDYEPVALFVLTDEKWLQFVIEQVLSNAVKYTRAGSVSIFAEGEVLCIKDTGIGIAPEDLPRVFERGYTGCNGRTDMKASGIGLYLCKRICQALGHEISAQSDMGGTTIRIDLSSAKVDIRD